MERVVTPHDDDALDGAEFLDDVLDAAAANADAGTHAVHPGVDAADGYLGAIAGLAGDALDLDGAVLHLRDLPLEEPLYEHRVGPGKDHLHAVPGLLDVEDHLADLLANVVRLAGDLLAARQDRLGLADGHDGGPALHTGD